ncbi:hypothetical protein, partial [Streptomyces noursei]|uniref:hypothetical protein n=1 Tax=Streptomyces noursei TaxID=1971 RepID=UPI0035D9D2D9
MATDDRELLLSRNPDKRALSEKMHRLGFGSYYDFPEKIPAIKSTEVPANHWKDPVGNNSDGPRPHPRHRHHPLRVRRGQ